SKEQSQYLSQVEEEIRAIEADLPTDEEQFLRLYRAALAKIENLEREIAPNDQKREAIFHAAPKLRSFLDLMNEHGVTFNEEELIKQCGIWGLNDIESRTLARVLDSFAEERHFRGAYISWTEHLESLKLEALDRNFQLPERPSSPNTTATQPTTTKAETSDNTSSAEASLGPERSLTEPQYLFKQHDGGWQIRFNGPSIGLEDSRGLLYIATLLRNPDQEVHVNELHALRRDPGCVSESRRGKSPVMRLSGEKFDRRARIEDFEREGLSVEQGLGSSQIGPDDTAIKQ